MKTILKATLALAVAASLAGCAAITRDLQKADAAVDKYAPIVGKDLILVADILVQAECSPAMQSGSQVATNILKVVAPNSKSAVTVQNVLATNAQVAQQLCPFVTAIKASVGSVPQGNPTQVVPAVQPTAAPASAPAAS